ncbi:MAG: prepilin peptidase [Lachnospiraceae bacterium]
MHAEIYLFILMLIVAFIYGIVIGSFLNVLIYRIPLKENIATNRSHCMKCGNQIKWYDLVPLVSYICLRGKCRHCGQKISKQYPLIEGINGCGYVLIFAVNGFSLLSILYCLVFSILIVISVIDWRTYEIPPSLNLAIGVIGAVRAAIDYENLLEYLIGFCAVSGFLLILFLLTKGRGIGGGDIKLMAAAGLFLGWKNIILAFIIGTVLGAVIHVTLMKLKGKERMLAFGPYLSAGIFIAMLFGNTIITWYMSLFNI